ncbi:MAG: efflux RND transporter periplasmic adaptor subunit [Pirellulales bacterium]
MKKPLLVLIVVGVAVGGTWSWWNARALSSSGALYRTVTLQKDDLLVTINATGTLQPEEVVDVGAQVAGKVAEFGKDPTTSKAIDYGSQVQPDTVLAKIDDSLYREELNQAKAELAKAQARLDQREIQVTEAEANIKRAEADLGQLHTKLEQTERDWDRAKKLVQQNVVSQQEYERLESTSQTARAAVAVGDAALLQARITVKVRKAAVEEAKADIQSTQASLNRVEKNLSYTTIKSPIAGVIIDRRVNIGQTVLASLNAPSLFLIAKDLKRMQVWASVNEADIGQIRVGMPARFTVDTFPDEVFHGTVAQIRLNAMMTQNVVSYTVVLTADNANGLLLPYLTANVDFEVDEKQNVPLVPNSALYWQPTLEQVASLARTMAKTILAGEGPGARKGEAPSGKVVWLQDGDFVRPISVHVGQTDGTHTEIIAGDLPADALIVTGLQPQLAADDAAASPFTPQLKKR